MTKSLLKVCAIALFGMLALSQAAQAQHAPRKGYRYNTTYREFDGGFHSYYSYNEDRTVCRSSYNSYTCFDVRETDTVYVEEQITEGGYERITVSRYSDGSSPFCEYYTYGGRVVRRHYYSNGYYYGGDYITPGYDQRSWVSIDWSEGWATVLVGAYTTDIGLSVLANSNGNSTAAGIGASLAILGSISMSIGSEEIQEESDLQKSIIRQHSANNANTVE